MANTNRLLSTAGAAGLAVMAIGSPALAENEFSWSITVAGTSDYVFRGLSLSDEDPAFQPAINFSYGIFYAGAWGSNLVGDGFSPWETDLYAGIKPVLGPVTFDFGVVWYIYPGADTGGSLGLDYVEFKAGASASPVTNLTVNQVFWYTPDQENYLETWTSETSAAFTLPAVGIFTPTVSGLLGYAEGVNEADLPFLGENNYTYWNAGLALGVEKFTFDFRYWDTDIDDPTADERFVFTASVTLP